jgi:hypothetical protein
VRFPIQQRRNAVAVKDNQEKQMSKLSRALAIALLAASVPAGIVVAQQATAPSEPPAAEESEESEGPRGLSPETEARFEDGRIAMAKAALKLTPDQEKLWAPVEEKIRADYAERRKEREEWRAKREERRASREEKQKLALPERIEKRTERMTERASKMTERAAKLKEFAEVVKPFYASLSDEQKEVADHMLRRFSRDGHHGRGGHHGRRWAMGPGWHDKSCN